MHRIIGDRRCARRDDVIEIITDTDDVEDDDDDMENTDYDCGSNVDDTDANPDDDDIDTENDESPFTCRVPIITDQQDAVDNELSSAVFPPPSSSAQRCCCCNSATCRSDGGDNNNTANESSTSETMHIFKCFDYSQRFQLMKRGCLVIVAGAMLLVSFAWYMEQLNVTDTLLQRLDALRPHPRPAYRRSVLGMLWIASPDPARLTGLGALMFVNGVVFYALCVPAVVVTWWKGSWRQWFPFPAKR